jgi:hypothetical protein
MKILVTILPMGLALGLAGCTSTSPLALDRVGPAPQAILAKAPQGYLVVSPALLPLTTLDDPDMSLRSNYRILSSDGTLYRNVRIWVPDVLHEPAPLALPPGLYTIEARATGYRRVSVPVVIEADRTTIVRLNGQARSEDLAASDVVAFPDGSVVGWRAQ